MQNDLTGLPLFDSAAGVFEKKDRPLSKTAIAVIEAGIRRRARYEASKRREQERKAAKRQARQLERIGENVVSLCRAKEARDAAARVQASRERRFARLCAGETLDDRDRG
jgi:hypothetical protein